MAATLGELLRDKLDKLPHEREIEKLRADLHDAEAQAQYWKDKHTEAMHLLHERIEDVEAMKRVLKVMLKEVV